MQRSYPKYRDVIRRRHRDKKRDQLLNLDIDGFLRLCAEPERHFNDNERNVSASYIRHLKVRKEKDYECIRYSISLKIRYPKLILKTLRDC